MKAIRQIVVLGLVVGLQALAGADPVVDSLSTADLPRSGRLRIFGSGFGAMRGDGRVEVAGQAVPLTTWSDTEIHAYIPGDAPLGAATLSVVAGGIPSNGLPVQILPIEPGSEHVRWRFRADSALILHRPAIAPDGMVYVNDQGGFLYAIDPAGALRWIYDTRGSGIGGPVAVAPDGTICVASNPLGPEVKIHAVNPDGTQRWVFTNPDAQENIAGPNVGPDGNIYAVHESFDGISAFSLDPAGGLRWNQSGFTDFGQMGQEIVFGPPGQAYFCLRGDFTAFDLGGSRRWLIDVGASSEQVAVGPDGSVYVEVFVTGAGIRLRSFDPGGSLRWTFFGPGTNMISAPDVGPDGTVYIVRNGIQVHAINPDGSLRWLRTDDNFFGPVAASQSPYSGPVVGPNSTTLLIGGVTTIGGPGVVKAFDPADGAALWTVQLPLENGGRVVPSARAMFTSDGTTAYVGMALPGQDPTNEYSYLYAFQTGAACPADIDGDGDADVADFFAFILAFASGDPVADINGDGSIDVGDFFAFVAAFAVGCP